MARETRSVPRPRGEAKLPGRKRPSRQVQSAIALLRSWQEGDAEEQRETWEFLRKALDEDRPSYRKLFP